MKTSLIATVGIFSLIHSAAFAEEQGQVGTSSSATVSMTVTIDPQFTVNHDAAAFRRSGDPRHLPVTTNFDGGYSVEKIEVPPLEKRVIAPGDPSRTASRKPAEKRYAYVIIPSAE